MKKRIRLWSVAAVGAVAIALATAGGALLLQRDRSAEPVGGQSRSASGAVVDISAYRHTLALNMDENLPPAEILQMGGSGLQLYDTAGRFINGETVLDAREELTAFLRVVWLEDYAADCSLALLADNHIQPFCVDGASASVELLTVRMQPKSSLSIPVTVRVCGDAAVSESRLTFLLLSYDRKKSDSGEGDETQLPNSTNSLTYAVQTDRRDYASDTAAAAYERQNESNRAFTDSEAFYAVLSPQNGKEFTFYREQPLLRTPRYGLYYYAMGRGPGVSFLLAGERLIPAFGGKPYLAWSLDETRYLKQAVTGEALRDGDRVLLISARQGQPPGYTVTAHQWREDW